MYHWQRATLIVAMILGATPAFADVDTPRVDHRQAHQDTRIDRGVASGALNARETARLDAEQNRIDRRESRYESDGVLTANERARLNASQARADRNIRRQKHDRQHR